MFREKITVEKYLGSHQKLLDCNLRGARRTISIIKGQSPQRSLAQLAALRLADTHHTTLQSFSYSSTVMKLEIIHFFYATTQRHFL